MRHSDHKQWRSLPAWVALMLVALACTCGPLNTVRQIQTTVGAAEATIAPVLTEIGQERPTLEAGATQIAGTLTAAAPEIEAAMTSMAGTANAAAPDLMATATAIAGGGMPLIEIQQWAISASATSQRGNSQWSAEQAAGAPDTPLCGDNPTAWASATSNETGVHLTLEYAIPVTPTKIVIYQTYSPSSVIKVVVRDDANEYTVYSGQPAAVATCPYIMEILVSGVNAKIRFVDIELDQSLIGNWDEIDSVQLVGTP